MSACKEVIPLCPQCRHPLGGGCGGMPWTCFRGCRPRPELRQLCFVPSPPNPGTAPLCPKCRQPMHGGRGGMPWTCFRICRQVLDAEEVFPTWPRTPAAKK